MKKRLCVYTKRPAKGVENAHVKQPCKNKVLLSYSYEYCTKLALLGHSARAINCMDNLTENVCCRRHVCVSTVDQFETIVLDKDVLGMAIMNQSHVFADDPSYTPASFRMAAYRQWIMWQHGYLGRANQKVVPSCVVWTVRI